jgi:hypothetical protein
MEKNCVVGISYINDNNFSLMLGAEVQYKITCPYNIFTVKGIAADCIISLFTDMMFILQVILKYSSVRAFRT